MNKYIVYIKKECVKCGGYGYFVNTPPCSYCKDGYEYIEIDLESALIDILKSYPNMFSSYINNLVI